MAPTSGASDVTPGFAGVEDHLAADAVAVAISNQLLHRAVIEALIDDLGQRLSYFAIHAEPLTNAVANDVLQSRLGTLHGSHGGALRRPRSDE
eukprot:2107224-Prorocentrum_lima.AAC.1